MHSLALMPDDRLSGGCCLSLCLFANASLLPPPLLCLLLLVLNSLCQVGRAGGSFHFFPGSSFLTPPLLHCHLLCLCSGKSSCFLLPACSSFLPSTKLVILVLLAR